MCAPTSCYPKDPHDSYDGGIDGQGSIQVDLLQGDSHDGQQHDGEVQLVPSRNKHIHSAQLPAADSVLLMARRPDQPFLEEASQAKGDEFEDGLDDKNDGEDVIAVLEHLLEVLRDAKGERETRALFKQQPVHCTTVSLHYRWFWGKWQEVLPWLPEAGCSAPCSW